MNYKDYTLGDWIGHISGIIEDETTLDGNEMRDLVEFLTTIREPKTDADCISRQATLKPYETLKDDDVICVWLIRKGIEQQPSVNPIESKTDILLKQNDSELNRVKDELESRAEWIPVHKRLPEPFRFVNCTCHSLIDNREDWVIETCYVPQPPSSPYSDWGNIPMLNDGDCKVVAWMYRDIPKPYKESED